MPMYNIARQYHITTLASQIGRGHQDYHYNQIWVRLRKQESSG